MSLMPSRKYTPLINEDDTASVAGNLLGSYDDDNDSGDYAVDIPNHFSVPA